MLSRILDLTQWKPFWMGMPFVDVDTLFTPDILHQLHKGMFQTHLLTWVRCLMSDEEFDLHLKMMPNYSGIRHFGKGILHISQMMGKEEKELEKVLMVIIAGHPKIPPAASIAASGLMNFIYLARYPQHHNDSLKCMQQ